jgi:ATP adenylyltransferase
MDYLWSPWRFHYVSKPEPRSTCLFCEKLCQANDAENLIIRRARRNFVLLNIYPYTTGHLMIAPYEHVATLEEAAEETLTEMIFLTRQAVAHLRTIYNPQGINLGMNIGECAGAGVAGHIHMHVVPRWVGDSNFMTTIGETRVLPEDLKTTYEKLSRAFAGPR